MLIAWEAPLYQVLSIQAGSKTSHYGADNAQATAAAAVSPAHETEVNSSSPPVISSEHGHINSLRLAQRLSEIMKGGKQ